MLRRLLETFFRRPFVCLLPLLLLTAFGIWSVSDRTQVYTSRGVMSVSNSTLLANLAEVPTGAEVPWWETPAEMTSRTINELMGTDQFTERVAANAGLDDDLAKGTVELDDIRRWVGTAPSGNNLVSIWASTPEPELSTELAKATIDTFVDWAGEGDLAESEAAEDFFARQTAEYEDELAAARAALDAFVRANDLEGLQGADDVPLALQSEYSRLQSDVARAESRYTNALQRVEEARLAMEQAMSNVQQRLRVLDSPTVPERPITTPTRRDAVLTVGLFMVAGFLFSAGLVVMGTLLDRTLRSADDVRNRLGVEVLAVVPAASRR